jgi:hypothetical protein
MALINSKHCKISNGILFVIFGRRNQKIWIMQVCRWFENNLNRFDPKQTLAHHVVVFHWPVPFHSDYACESLDLMRSARPRLTGTGSLKWTDLVLQIQIEWERLNRGEAHLARVRSPARIPARACRWWSPASYWWLLDDGKGTTRCGRTRRPRECERRPRSLTEKG